MSVLTLPARPGEESPPRPVRWRGMAWVTWRQHRATFISVPAVLGAIAVFLVIFGRKVHRDYAALVHCPIGGPVSGLVNGGGCGNLMSSFNSFDWTVGNVCAILLQLAPVLIGAFAGAPLLARELETGTYRYAWTQGLGRERQAIAKLALIGAALAILAGAFGTLFAWFFQPFLYVEQMNVLTETVFDTRGLVFPACTLVAFAVGAFLGMLLRRIVPALAATMGVYLVIRLVAWGTRKYYPVAVVTSNAKVIDGFQTPGRPGYPWILSSWLTGPGGKPVGQSVISQFKHSPGPNPSPPPGYTQWYRWIPLSRFWPMQFIEAGWLLILAVAVMAATVWLVRHRAA